MYSITLLSAILLKSKDYPVICDVTTYRIFLSRECDFAILFIFNSMAAGASIELKLNRMAKSHSLDKRCGTP